SSFRLRADGSLWRQSIHALAGLQGRTWDTGSLRCHGRRTFSRSFEKGVQSVATPGRVLVGAPWKAHLAIPGLFADQRLINARFVLALVLDFIGGCATGVARTRTRTYFVRDC